MRIPRPIEHRGHAVPVHDDRECCGSCYRRIRTTLRCHGEYFIDDMNGGCRMHFEALPVQDRKTFTCRKCGKETFVGSVCCNCMTDAEKLVNSREYDRAMSGYSAFD